MTFILTAFREGGLFMYFIFGFGLLSAGFIVERYLELFVRAKSAPQDFRAQVLNFLSRGDLNGAQSYIQTSGNGAAVATVALVGIKIRNNAGGEEELQARMDERLSHEISHIDRRTGFLGMFGNVATLLGLLGTISGMIHSFAAVANASPADRATMLSKGISEAMNCTAFGLLVAIPALVAYAVFQNRTDRLVTEMTETTTEIYNDLLFLTESEKATTYRGIPIAPGTSPSVSV